ncbi:hypothetical protein ACFL38_05040, partial [Candidatus Omnitrophota bacterium]
MFRSTEQTDSSSINGEVSVADNADEGVGVSFTGDLTSRALIKPVALLAGLVILPCLGGCGVDASAAGAALSFKIGNIGLLLLWPVLIGTTLLLMAKQYLTSIRKIAGIIGKAILISLPFATATIAVHEAGHMAVHNLFFTPSEGHMTFFSLRHAQYTLDSIEIDKLSTLAGQLGLTDDTARLWLFAVGVIFEFAYAITLFVIGRTIFKQRLPDLGRGLKLAAILASFRPLQYLAFNVDQQASEMVRFDWAQMWARTVAPHYLPVILFALSGLLPLILGVLFVRSEYSKPTQRFGSIRRPTRRNGTGDTTTYMHSGGPDTRRVVSRFVAGVKNLLSWRNDVVRLMAIMKTLRTVNAQQEDTLGNRKLKELIYEAKELYRGAKLWNVDPVLFAELLYLESVLEPLCMGGMSYVDIRAELDRRSLDQRLRSWGVSTQESNEEDLIAAYSDPVLHDTITPRWVQSFIGDPFNVKRDAPARTGLGERFEDVVIMFGKLIYRTIVIGDTVVASTRRFTLLTLTFLLAFAAPAAGAALTLVNEAVRHQLSLDGEVVSAVPTSFENLFGIVGATPGEAHIRANILLTTLIVVGAILVVAGIVVGVKKFLTLRADVVEFRAIVRKLRAVKEGKATLKYIAFRGLVAKAKMAYTRSKLNNYDPLAYAEFISLKLDIWETYSEFAERVVGGANEVALVNEYEHPATRSTITSERVWSVIVNPSALSRQEQLEPSKRFEHVRRVLKDLADIILGVILVAWLSLSFGYCWVCNIDPQRQALPGRFDNALRSIMYAAYSFSSDTSYLISKLAYRVIVAIDAVAASTRRVTLLTLAFLLAFAAPLMAATEGGRIITIVTENALGEVDSFTVFVPVVAEAAEVAEKTAGEPSLTAATLLFAGIGWLIMLTLLEVVRSRENASFMERLRATGRIVVGSLPAVAAIVGAVLIDPLAVLQFTYGIIAVGGAIGAVFVAAHIVGAIVRRARGNVGVRSFGRQSSRRELFRTAIERTLYGTGIAVAASFGARALASRFQAVIERRQAARKASQIEELRDQFEQAIPVSVDTIMTLLDPQRGQPHLIIFLLHQIPRVDRIVLEYELRAELNAEIKARGKEYEVDDVFETIIANRDQEKIARIVSAALEASGLENRELLREVMALARASTEQVAGFEYSEVDLKDPGYISFRRYQEIVEYFGIDKLHFWLPLAIALWETGDLNRLAKNSAGAQGIFQNKYRVGKTLWKGNGLIGLPGTLRGWDDRNKADYRSLNITHGLLVLSAGMNQNLYNVDKAFGGQYREGTGPIREGRISRGDLLLLAAALHYEGLSEKFRKHVKGLAAEHEKPARDKGKQPTKVYTYKDFEGGFVKSSKHARDGYQYGVTVRNLLTVIDTLQGVAHQEYSQLNRVRAGKVSVNDKTLRGTEAFFNKSLPLLRPMTIIVPVGLLILGKLESILRLRKNAIARAARNNILPMLAAVAVIGGAAALALGVGTAEASEVVQQACPALGETASTLAIKGGTAITPEVAEAGGINLDDTVSAVMALTISPQILERARKILDAWLGGRDLHSLIQDIPSSKKLIRELKRKMRSLIDVAQNGQLPRCVKYPAIGMENPGEGAVWLDIAADFDGVIHYLERTNARNCYLRAAHRGARSDQTQKFDRQIADRLNAIGPWIIDEVKNQFASRCYDVEIKSVAVKGSYLWGSADSTPVDIDLFIVVEEKGGMQIAGGFDKWNPFEIITDNYPTGFKYAAPTVEVTLLSEQWFLGKRKSSRRCDRIIGAWESGIVIYGYDYYDYFNRSDTENSKDFIMERARLTRAYWLYRDAFVRELSDRLRFIKRTMESQIVLCAIMEDLGIAAEDIFDDDTIAVLQQNPFSILRVSETFRTYAMEGYKQIPLGDTVELWMLYQQAELCVKKIAERLGTQRLLVAISELLIEYLPPANQGGQEAPKDASADGLPRRVIAIVVKITQFLTGKHISDWTTIDISADEIQQAIISELQKLEDGRDWLAETKNIIFVRAPPVWVLRSANHFENGINYIILPENAPSNHIAHEINAVVNPELTHANNLTLPQTAPTVAGEAPVAHNATNGENGLFARTSMTRRSLNVNKNSVGVPTSDVLRRNVGGVGASGTPYLALVALVALAFSIFGAGNSETTGEVIPRIIAASSTTALASMSIGEWLRRLFAGRSDDQDSEVAGNEAEAAGVDQNATETAGPYDSIHQSIEAALADGSSIQDVARMAVALLEEAARQGRVNSESVFVYGLRKYIDRSLAREIGEATEAIVVQRQRIRVAQAVVEARRNRVIMPVSMDDEWVREALAEEAQAGKAIENVSQYSPETRRAVRLIKQGRVF